MKEIAVIHVLKIKREGNSHLNGTVSVFNARQDSILDDAKSFNDIINVDDGKPNYKVVSIIMHNYKNDNASVWTDFPVSEAFCWENNDAR